MGFFSSLFGLNGSQGNANRPKSAAPKKILSKSQILILLATAEKYKVTEVNFPQTYQSQYGIYNPKQNYQALAEQGYIRATTNKEALPHLKNDELKSIISTLGLSGGGKKEELCKCIREQSEEDALNRFQIPRYWKLTEKGQQELDNNPYIELYAGKHSYSLLSVGVGFDEVASELVNASPQRYRDVVWRKLGEKSLQYYKDAARTKNFHLYCELLRTMALFVEEEGKYKEALHHYLRCTFYKVEFQATLAAVSSYNITRKLSEATSSFIIEAELLPFEIDDYTRLISECGFKRDEFDSFALEMLNRETDTGVFNPNEMVEFINCGLQKKLGKQKTMFSANFKKQARIK